MLCEECFFGELAKIMDPSHFLNIHVRIRLPPQQFLMIQMELCTTTLRQMMVRRKEGRKEEGKKGGRRKEGKMKEGMNRAKRVVSKRVSTR